MKPVPRCAWPSRGAFLALLLAIARPAIAQESAFSLQFLGSSEETGDARARGLGVLGIALDDHRTAITLNPASLGGLNAMTISVMGLGGARISTSPEGEDKASVARFPHERGALPLFGKVVANVGIVALRNFRSDFTLGAKQIEGFGYVQRFERDGDLYTIPIGLAGSITSRVRLGATFDFLLGTLEESWVTEGDSIVSLRTRRRDEMRGRTFTLGWMVLPVSWLRVGGSWNPEFNVERNRDVTLEDARATTTPTPLRKESSQEDVRFPQALRLGISADLGARFLVAGDYLWRQWESYDGSLYEAEAVGNESRFGGGVEWVPGKKKYSYRLGGSHTVWPQSVGGDQLQETAVHFGLGVAFSAGGRLDLSLEHAWIGSLDTNGMEERAWRFGVSLSGQEVWKRRSPRG